MSSINFDNIYLLLLAIPFIALIVIPFALAVKKDNRNGHNVASHCMHIVMALLIAFTAAGTKIVSVMTETDIYIVADVSYSTDRNLEKVDEYIANVQKNLPANSKIGVICFGKDQELYTKLGGTVTSVKDTTVDRSETNINAALEYAAAMFPEDVIKRIVLITDGKQSDTKNSGSLMKTVDKLHDANIHVDAMYLNDNITDDDKEVQISDVEYTATAYKSSGTDKSETATVKIQSTYTTNAMVSLYRDGDTMPEVERPVLLTKGITNVNFDLDTTFEGTFDYEVKVVVQGEDASPYNNHYNFTQKVSDLMNILLVTDNRGADERYLSSIYGSDAHVTAIDPASKNFPYGVEELCAYDEIVLSDFNIAKISELSMFAESLNTVVSSFGKSLVALGNLEIQNHNSGDIKALSDMLPVQYGKTDDSKLYTVVLDISDSVNLASRFAVAKKAVEHLLSLLVEGDSVAIVGFHGNFEIIQDAVPVTPETINSIINKVNAYSTYQGTYISVGLERAYQMMKDLPFGEKQIMLITDGMTNASDFGGADGESDIIKTVKAMASNEIYTSVIDLGRTATDSGNSVTAVSLLKQIASEGYGTYYYATNTTQLEDVFFGEILDDVTESVITERSGVTINKRTDSILKDVELGENPFVDGFVKSKAKSNATTVLSARYYRANGMESVAPLYSYWNYGNGKVSVLTTVAGDDWLQTFDGGIVNSNGCGEQFVYNIIETDTPSEKIDHPFNVNVIQDGAYARIEAVPAALHADSAMRISVSRSGAAEKIETNKVMDFDSSTYYYEFPISEVGKYNIDLSYRYNDQVFTANVCFNISYLNEYNSFETFDAAVLYGAIASAGNVSEDGTLTIVNDEKEVGLYVIELTMPMMIACVVLFVADVIVRKLKWNDIVSLFVKVNKENAK